MDSLGRVIALTDRSYGPTAWGLGAAHAPWKEWFHFCVLGPGVQVIANFNLGADLRPAATPRSQVARVILLVREEQWRGGIETLAEEEVRIRPGVIDLEFGPSRLRFESTAEQDAGLFKMRILLREQPLALELTLRPLAAPLRSTDTPLEEGVLHWVVVPYLLASGWVRVGRRVHHLEAAPAYHDHNWGTWRWGGDFAWEWGFALPCAPDARWSLVYSRMTDRARTEERDRKFYVWRHETLSRLYCREEVERRSSGWLRADVVPKFPPAMGLICPGQATGVPEVLEVSGRRSQEHFGFTFHAEDVMQLLVPNEADLGTTIINEAAGRIRLTGELGGIDSDLEGRGIFEFLTMG